MTDSRRRNLKRICATQDSLLQSLNIYQHALSSGGFDLVIFPLELWTVVASEAKCSSDNVNRCLESRSRIVMAIEQTFPEHCNCNAVTNAFLAFDQLVIFDFTPLVWLGDFGTQSSHSTKEIGVAPSRCFGDLQLSSGDDELIICKTQAASVFSGSNTR